MAKHPPPTIFKTCPFCGGTPLTKTHIWPRWLKNTIPPKNTYFDQTINLRLSDATDRANRQQYKRKYKKDIFAQAPYISCFRCNGGWMKDFEDRVAVFIKPILTGEYIGKLIYDECKALSGWISLITLLKEMHSWTTGTVSSSDINYIRSNGHPPTTWTIAISPCEGPDWQRLYQYHNMGCYDSLVQIKFMPNGLVRPNTQISFFGIGSVVFMVFTSDNADIIIAFRRYIKSIGFKLLWPQWMMRRGLVFPFGKPKSDAQMDAIEQDLFEALKYVPHIL